jgi:hypothetical protein
MITAVVRATSRIELAWELHIGALGELKSAPFAALVLAKLVEDIALLDVVRLLTGIFGGVGSPTD